MQKENPSILAGAVCSVRKATARYCPEILTFTTLPFILSNNIRELKTVNCFWTLENPNKWSPLLDVAAN